ncbi:MAG: hypothetical protein BMS9Abin23_0892 [Thermodesulfobacteriota bacterium]|nr:MAG: hypothetical protein BMS9Abin23_0892 [Thermodesulfobacteriota bacterium]
MSVHTKTDDFGKKAHLFDWKNRKLRPLEKVEKDIIIFVTVFVIGILLFFFAL